MPVVDRMNYPRKFKLKDSLLIFAMIATVFGIWTFNRNQKKILANVIISEVRIDDFSRQHIEISYRVQNKFVHETEVRILARVLDSEGSELASAMFMSKFPRRSDSRYTKIFTELSRLLREGEIPASAEVRVYPRKVL